MSASWLERLYGWLLWLYPADFRRAYGPWMVQLLRDQQRDAAGQGVRGLLRLAGLTGGDLIRSAARERWDSMARSAPFSPKNRWVTLVALGLLAVIAYLDLFASEIQAPLAGVLMATFVLGFWRPKGAWRWAVLCVAAILLAEGGALLLGFEPVGYAHSRAVNPDKAIVFTAANAAQSLIVLIPGLVSAYAGALAGKLARQLFHRSPDDPTLPQT